MVEKNQSDGREENLLVGQEIGDREASRRSRKGPGLRS